ncbi:hypothetical protein DDI_1063 [Dickeya dianthicola RNS04.9]|nr:hypothetical protein DDI_1063 [Dickeya dianthicola RNS04.9]
MIPNMEIFNLCAHCYFIVAELVKCFSFWLYFCDKTQI